jgi:peptide/nickel transport system substrate-binding protein
MTRRRSLLVLAACLASSHAYAQHGGELRFCLRSEPKTFNPLLVTDEAAETIRYLTGGVLIRVNRSTQELQPELAVSWKILAGGRKIAFVLRQGVSFSDGTPFSAEDVAYTMRALMDPDLHSSTGDSFRSGAGSIDLKTSGPYQLTITFPAPVPGMERLFDQVAIVSASSQHKEAASLGPFCMGKYKAGSYVLLHRNPHYWKHDDAGRALPYLDSIRLDIQKNRDLEMLRFRRGQLHLINNLDPELFDQLEAEAPSSVHDAGASLDSELLWFNQVASSPLPAYKKAWFRSRGFRRAISEAINREDLCRVVYRGHASPAAGPVSPANQFWFRAGLKPHAFDPQAALHRLEQEGFRLDGAVLRDREGHPVEFSVVTNAGNKPRERMAVMIQQDLGKLGVRLNVVTLDFPSLIDRISRSFDYEACLLGFVNDDMDPNAQMNVWLSSASNHQWNPNQKSPETEWEAKMDRLMRAQASLSHPKKRKAAFDEVQNIVWDQAPFLYLVYKNSLSAVSAAVQNAHATGLRPQTYWNAERLSLASEVARSR